MAAIWLVVSAAIWAVLALAHSVVDNAAMVVVDSPAKVAVDVMEETVDMVRCLGKSAEVEADVGDHITASSCGGIDTGFRN
jgi:Mrp family chromosome partitioning ATPase